MILQRSECDGFAHAFPVSVEHMSAYSCLGMRSALHYRRFYAQGPDGCLGDLVEVWWTIDKRTGHVTDIFEDSQGLNHR